MFLELTETMIILQNLIVQCSLCYLSSGCLQEVKNKAEFQTFSSKSDRNCL